MLGAIESLLSAVVSDGMAGTKHDSDVELLALGVANVVVPFFGGFAATGAIARTATNVRSGARSPLASIVHAGFVLASVLTLAPLLGRIPMASLAALLLMVAWNMSEVRHFAHMMRIAPNGDTAVLLACFALTVVFDMTIAVTAGVLLAALLFMRRMIEISGARLIGERHPQHGTDLPPGVLVYDIQGPLFFGAAHKATSQLFSFNRKGVRVVLMDLEDVPAIDATGIVNLRSAIDRLQSGGIAVVLFGLQHQPLRALAKAGLLQPEGQVEHYATFEAALSAARVHLATPTRSAAG
jgi:SulP family sulfate permease